MTLLVGEALKIAEHALGGQVHPAITGLRILNDVGEWLVSARPWAYLRGGMEALDITSGQGWVDLPDDFGAVIQADRSSGMSYAFILTTPEELLRLRTTTSVGATHTLWGAVTWDHADISGDTSNDSAYDVTPTTAAEAAAKKRPTPRLDLFPLPTASTAGALLIFYTRGWRKVIEDTDTIFIPEWLESLYLRAVRIWAKGYEEEDDFDKDRALASLMMGPEWYAAVKRDGGIQMERGVLRGGVTERRAWYRNLDGTVTGPS